MPTRTVAVFGIGASMSYTCGPTTTDICVLALDDSTDGHRELVTLPVGVTVRNTVQGGSTPTCLITDPADTIAYDQDSAASLAGDSVAECTYQVE